MFFSTNTGSPSDPASASKIYVLPAPIGPAIAAPGSERGMSAAHCQSPQVLIDRYAEKTGRDTQYFRWYEVFAAWKLAIVLEGSYAKYLSGESKNTHHEFFGFVVDRLLERAQRLVE